MLFSDNSFTKQQSKKLPHMQCVQFIIQPAFGFMNPINEYWSHQYQCAMQFYLNENSTHFGCREGDSFVLLCLSLAALKRCFANQVQRLQLPHHLSRSPGNCLPATISVTKQFMSCRVSAESRTAQLHSPNSFSSQLPAKPVAELQSQFIELLSWFYVVTGPWQLKSLTSGKGKAKGENRDILPGFLLSSQWQVNQTEAALAKLLLH